jgi:hypothetical protein
MKCVARWDSPALLTVTACGSAIRATERQQRSTWKFDQFTLLSSIGLRVAKTSAADNAWTVLRREHKPFRTRDRARALCLSSAGFPIEVVPSPALPFSRVSNRRVVDALFLRLQSQAQNLFYLS